MTTEDGREITLEDHERQLTEVWSRVMGYYQVRENFNPGKKSEFADRKFFAEPADILRSPQRPLDV